jgi:hypothetical protein
MAGARIEVSLPTPGVDAFSKPLAVHLTWLHNLSISFSIHRKIVICGLTREPG